MIAQPPLWNEERDRTTTIIVQQLPRSLDSWKLILELVEALAIRIPNNLPNEDGRLSRMRAISTHPYAV